MARSKLLWKYVSVLVPLLQIIPKLKQVLKWNTDWYSNRDLINVEYTCNITVLFLLNKLLFTLLWMGLALYCWCITFCVVGLSLWSSKSFFGIMSFHCLFWLYWNEKQLQKVNLLYFYFFLPKFCDTFLHILRGRISSKQRIKTCLVFRV